MTMDARKQRVLQAIVALYGLEGRARWQQRAGKLL